MNLHNLTTPIKMLIFIVSLCFFSTLIHASNQLYLDELPVDGTRELTSATDSFLQHALKSADYRINMSTPGFIRKSVTNVRVYNQEKTGHLVEPNLSFKWIEGPVLQTGNPMHFCVRGDNRAFFTVLLPNNIIGFTRDGRFRIDHQNHLVTLSGNYPVLSTEGIITLPSLGDLSISRTGGVHIDGEYIASLKITVFKYFDQMSRHLDNVSGSFFVLLDPIEVDNDLSAFNIYQGHITQSNSYSSRDSKWYTNYHEASLNALNTFINSKKTLYNSLAN